MVGWKTSVWPPRPASDVFVERAAAVYFSPTASSGSTLPMLTARSGSSPVASSQRPIQPVETGSAGEAVCQISMDRKWL
jgi:hypothetical protein